MNGLFKLQKIVANVMDCQKSYGKVQITNGNKEVPIKVVVLVMAKTKPLSELTLEEADSYLEAVSLTRGITHITYIQRVLV